MARGRGKKLTKKINREIKHSSPTTNYSALEEELLTVEQYSVRDGLPFSTTEVTDLAKNEELDEEMLEYAKWAQEAAEKAANAKGIKKVV
jgi:hypothetical protein